MNILVTGGAGFIGSHLVDRLLADGHGVVALDNLSTGSLENLDGCARHPAFELVIGSVRDAALVSELVDRSDAVLHFAAAVGVKLVLEKPSLSINTNVSGTHNVLHAASSRDKVVFIASTSEVYGKASKTPFREDDDLVMGSPANLRWSYAVAKILDECMALAYSQEEKVRTVIVRLFNTTGPRQTGRYGMVLPNFVTQAVEGRPITVYGDGEQSRCFSHVRDVVESVVRLMDCPAALGQVFNVGNDREITINQLATLVRTAAGSSSEIRHIPYEDAYTHGFEEMMRRVPDLGKLERTIGYRPQTPLEEIVREVILEKRSQLGLA